MNGERKPNEVRVRSYAAQEAKGSNPGDFGVAYRFILTGEEIGRLADILNELRGQDCRLRFSSIIRQNSRTGENFESFNLYVNTEAETKAFIDSQNKGVGRPTYQSASQNRPFVRKPSPAAITAAETTKRLFTNSGAK